MGIWAPIKYALNSTLGTKYFKPLDMILASKIVCRGTLGTKFSIKDNNGHFPTMETEITEKSVKLDGNLWCEIIPVPCGIYSIDINVAGTEINVPSLNVADLGKRYTFSYNSYTLIKTFTENGTFVVPDGVTEIFIDACSGGGGGGAGNTYSISSADRVGFSGGQGGGNTGAVAVGGTSTGNGTSGPGGGGGNGGAYIQKKRFAVSPGDILSIVIGKGGKGGGVDSSKIGISAGYNGSITQINPLVTVSGNGNKGGAGSAGKSATDTTGGAGGHGGSCPLSPYGKGGSGGHGGRGASVEGDYIPGVGTTYNCGAGKDGANGVVYIYTGVNV